MGLKRQSPPPLSDRVLPPLFVHGNTFDLSLLKSGGGASRKIAPRYFSRFNHYVVTVYRRVLFDQTTMKIKTRPRIDRRDSGAREFVFSPDDGPYRPDTTRRTGHSPYHHPPPPSPRSRLVRHRYLEIEMVIDPNGFYRLPKTNLYRLPVVRWLVEYKHDTVPNRRDKRAGAVQPPIDSRIIITLGS